ncbi:MAG: DNA polymerase I [Candidatus Tectomicrobia bacterium]|uniref:DNA polymerase I n=1 Tax=Tectimicrobiota bacterium TaxID=2528274 RepID=A0A932HZE5_UNCTE|nr:DNA polymerase I [Candidatus Tectomicrobia bacterium]
MTARNKRIFLLDGSGYMFRAYYGMMRQRLSNSKGRPTGAVYAFARMLLKVIREKAPEYIAVAFDRPEPTFRHELYPAYKSNRDAPPEDMVEQIPLMQRAVEALRIPVLIRPGAEADDLIGSLARRALAKGFDVMLVTGDKDFSQLVSDRVRIWDPMRDEECGPAEIEKKWGVPPARFVDIQALMGDTSDNVPGVPGVGEKTAVALIQEFGSLEQVIASAEKIARPKVRELIQEHAELARLSRELCTIRCDLEVDANLDRYRLGHADFEAARRLFVEELEFKSLVEQLPGYAPPAEEEETEAPAAPAPRADVDHCDLRDLKELAALVKELKRAGCFALDLETTSLDPMQAGIVGISLSPAPGKARYIPVGHDRMDAGPQPPLKEVLERLRPLLADPKAEKVGQNIKYDMAVLARAGVEIEGPLFDTMVASYLLHSDRTSHGFDHLALEFLGETTIKYEELCGKGAKQIGFSSVPVDLAAAYSCQDADFTLRLARIMKEKLGQEGLDDLFHGLEMPLLRVLLEMERTGIRLDAEVLRGMGKELDARLEAMRAHIHELAGGEFNIQSTPQLREILFGKLGLPILKKTKTGASTDIDTLERLAAQHPLPQEILNYRQLAKLKNTYVDTLPGLVHPRTGRIHTDFNQTVAATGRLSSSNPNLQNIPIRTDLGREIRRAFLPEAGWRLLSADYGQIELRVLAHFTGDPGLVQAFERGEDIHATTAAAVYGVKPKEVAPEMRRVAKAVNFGIVYGQGAFGLSQTLGIPQGEAKAFIEAYFKRFARVPAFVEKTIKEGAERGYVSTLLGRRRYIPDLKSRNRNMRAAAERTAVNSVIQGSAADIIKRAMIRIAARLKKEKLAARLLLQVHDELLFEFPPKEEKALSHLVREEMEGAEKLSVPLAVEMSTGANWGEVH